MSSMISSLETIVLCSGAVIAAAILLWGLWKTYSFVGFPIGKMVMRLGDPETEDNVRSRSGMYGATLGGFLCYGLIAWKTMSSGNSLPPCLPGEEIYTAAIWLVKLILQACGESAAVLAILAGVVKVLRLDVRKEGPVSLDKEENHIA